MSSPRSPANPSTASALTRLSPTRVVRRCRPVLDPSHDNTGVADRRSTFGEAGGETSDELLLEDDEDDRERDRDDDRPGGQHGERVPRVTVGLETDVFQPAGTTWS
jgi:hypothetical protein